MINWILGIIILLIIVLAIRHIRQKGTCDCGCGKGNDCPHCHMDSHHKD